MKHNEIRQYMDKLTQKLRRHNVEYYAYNAPTISDQEYDLLLRELANLESQYPAFKCSQSPTDSVGALVPSTFEIKSHPTPLLSLSNAMSEEELLKSPLMSLDGVTYCCEPKIDGLTLSVLYIDGELTQAVLRGDGYAGEDVTANAMLIKSLPLKLKGDYPDRLLVRGEVYISNHNFELLNGRMKLEGRKPFSTPRNAAAGSLRLKDPSEVQKRQLDFFLHGLAQGDDASQYRMLKRLKSYGFTIPNDVKVVNTPDEVISYLRGLLERRYELGYDIDGAVIKVNETVRSESLGVTAKAPKGAIAFKYPPVEAVTLIEDVYLTTGRTGLLTPMVKLKPVMVSNTQIQSASLGSWDNMVSLGVAPQLQAWVRKAGDVIPQITSVVNSVGSKPTYRDTPMCPSCGSRGQHIDGGNQFYCLNTYGCEAQLLNRLIHFCSKGAMNIDGLGKGSIRKLYESGQVKTPNDFYDLSRGTLIDVLKVSDKVANKLLDALEKSKTVKFERLLVALGIPGIGHSLACKLAKQYSDPSELISITTPQEYLKIDDIGETRAKALTWFFTYGENQNIVLHLRKHLNIVKDPTFEGKYSGRVVAFTGTLDKYTRDRAVTLVERAGAEVVGSMSARVTDLVVGASPGSALDKAIKLGTKVHGEGFVDLVAVL